MPRKADDKKTVSAVPGFDEKEKNLAMLYNRREKLDDVRINIMQSFDKYLLSFATGSLYLSISYTNKLSEDLVDLYLLGIGWSLLIIVIIVTLLSIFFSGKAHTRQMEITDLEIEAENDEKIVIGHVNCWNSVIVFLEWVGIIGFVTGIASLALFYFTNL